MKVITIIAALVVGAFTVVAHEVGEYCSDINPYAPEDYPRGDNSQGS